MFRLSEKDVFFDTIARIRITNPVKPMADVMVNTAIFLVLCQNDKPRRTITIIQGVSLDITEWSFFDERASRMSCSLSTMLVFDRIS
jgi:hypothetical protein